MFKEVYEMSLAFLFVCLSFFFFSFRIHDRVPFSALWESYTHRPSTNILQFPNPEITDMIEEYTHSLSLEILSQYYVICLSCQDTFSLSLPQFTHTFRPYKSPLDLLHCVRVGGGGT